MTSTICCRLLTHTSCAHFFFHTFIFIIHHAAPLRRRMRFVRHEKGWMRRKRLKMERRYLRLQEGVEELKAYIKFKQEYRKK